ncbi:nuclease-related domain-containing protein [Marinobacter lipolyticus]
MFRVFVVETKNMKGWIFGDPLSALLGPGHIPF